MTKAELFQKIASDAAEIANKDSRLPAGIEGGIFRPSIVSSRLALDYSQSDVTYAVMAVKGHDVRLHRKRREPRSLDDIYSDMEKIAYDAIYEAVFQNLTETTATDPGITSYLFQQMREGKMEG